MATEGGGRAVGRASGCLLLVAVLAVMVVGCGDDADQPSADEIEQAMVEQFGADDDQAVCIRRYLVEDYEDAELRLLLADGVGALPQPRWEPFLTASVACLTQPLEDR